MEDNIFKKQVVPFTQVPNELLYDPRISFKAKGLWAYMSAKPDGWKFSADRISHETKEERKSILAGLRELVEFGYLTAKKCANGRMEYTLHYATVKPSAPPETAEQPQKQEYVAPAEKTPGKPVYDAEKARPRRSDYASEEEYEKASYSWNTVSIKALDKT